MITLWIRGEGGRERKREKEREGERERERERERESFAKTYINVKYILNKNYYYKKELFFLIFKPYCYLNFKF